MGLATARNAQSKTMPFFSTDNATSAALPELTMTTILDYALFAR